MPIKKNTTIWGIEDVTHLEFGFGDIDVMDASGHGYTTVMFKGTQCKPIGYENNNVIGMTATNVAPDVIMTFTKPESIDVLLEKLHYAKEELLIMQPKDTPIKGRREVEHQLNDLKSKLAMSLTIGDEIDRIALKGQINALEWVLRTPDTKSE
jgi:hypothetical protein